MPILKYFDSPVLNSERQLTYKQAMQRGHYVACYFNQDSPDFAEIFRRDKNSGSIMHRVVYYNRSWPNEVLIEEHLNRYPNIPFEVISPRIYKDDTIQLIIYKGDAQGYLNAIHEIHMNQDEYEILEVYRDALGNITSTLDYEYDENNDLLFTRERNPDGTIILEYYHD